MNFALLHYGRSALGIGRSALGLGRSALHFGLFAAFVLMMVAAIHPTVRTNMRSSLLPDYRSIASTAKGNLLGDDKQFTVVKIKTRSSLIIEVYGPEVSGQTPLVERIQIPDARDAYFSFNGDATNLAIDDIDGDNRPEILVPNFDKDMVGHLNIYKYNEGSRSFDKILR